MERTTSQLCFSTSYALGNSLKLLELKSVFLYSKVDVCLSQGIATLEKLNNVIFFPKYLSNHGEIEQINK